MTREPDAPGVLNPKPGIPKWALGLAALGFLAVAAVYAFGISFSYFAYYDDEGTMMISVRGCLDGHRLYDQVISYYGPVYYFCEWLIHGVARFPLDHDITRMFCILNWLAAAALLAVAGGRMTRSVSTAFFIFSLATLHLTPLAREPGHPQELVALLLAAAVLAAQKGLSSRWTLLLLGAMGAALAFTKINVGAFYAFGLALALCCRMPLLQTRRFLFWSALAASCVLPCLMMRTHLDQSWARAYCGQVCAAILTAAVIAFVFGREESRVGAAQLFQAGAGFAALSAIVIAGVLLAGSTLPAMVENLILGPARLGGAFFVPLIVPYSSASGAAALLAAGAAVAYRGRLEPLRFAIAGAKGLYGLLGAFWLLSDYNRQLGYLLPWSWLLLVPTGTSRAQESRGDFARIFLCLQSAWQGLQAYPAPGTQAVLATLLPLLVYSLCLHDALAAFATAPPVVQRLGRLTPRTAAMAKALGLAGLFYLFAVHWCNPVSSWRYYQSVPPLGLRGARYLRLPAEQGEVYRGLAQYLEAECNAFVTVPGLNSLYFWTGQTPPAWLTVSEAVLLSDDQQTRMVEALRKAGRPLVVVNVGSANFSPGQGPLWRFIAGCREVKQFGGFRILKPVEPPR